MPPEVSQTTSGTQANETQDCILNQMVPIPTSRRQEPNHSAPAT